MCAPVVATQVNVVPDIAVILTTSLVRDTYVQSLAPSVGKPDAEATEKDVAPSDIPADKVVAALLLNFTAILTSYKLTKLRYCNSPSNGH
jgi:hypothetical protein